MRSSYALTYGKMLNNRFTFRAIFALTTFKYFSTAFVPSAPLLLTSAASIPVKNNRQARSSGPFYSLGTIRGGSYSYSYSYSPLHSTAGDEVNGEGSKESPSSSSSSSSEKRASTGWNHNLPEEDSEFWTGKKELPKNYSSETETETESSASKNSNSSSNFRTGWLHSNKKKKEVVEQENTSTGNTARKMLEKAMMDQKMNHRIVSPPTFHPVAEGRRAVITEHKIALPLDRYNPPADEKAAEPMVDVYFSIVELVSTPEQESFFQSLQATELGSTKARKQREQKKRASDYKAFAKLENADDCILYLQGGPGFGAPSPVNGIGLSDSSSWVGAALSKGFKRVVLMDQRGTGRSSPITKQTLEKKFPGLFTLDEVAPTMIENDKTGFDVEEYSKSHPEESDTVQQSLTEATTYMTHFRADNIVKDAEAIKNTLLLPIDEDEEVEPVPRPWGASLGQSFGGFCTMSYLSLVPNPPRICLLTGGIAPMLTNVDEVYNALRERVKERNLKYYDRYTGDVDAVKRIVARLEKEPEKLPSGGILTSRRFLMVGIGLGGSPSAFASLHSLFSTAFISEDEDVFSKAFLKEIDGMQPFDDHPIYFLLHESIYADSNSECKKTNWSAFRAYDPAADFDVKLSSQPESPDPPFLTGEVVFPWMADGDFAELSGLGMRALAQSLANKDDWRDLYNPSNMRKALATDGSGTSKAAAAVYYDDMYVDFDACMRVTKRGGPLENCKVFISNEYQHSGLRDDGANIFNKILGMAKGEVGTPS